MAMNDDNYTIIHWKTYYNYAYYYFFLEKNLIAIVHFSSIILLRVNTVF